MSFRAFCGVILRPVDTPLIFYLLCLQMRFTGRRQDQFWDFRSLDKPLSLIVAYRPICGLT